MLKPNAATRNQLLSIDLAPIPHITAILGSERALGEAIGALAPSRYFS